MGLTIEEQKKYLKEQLYVQMLRERPENKDEIKNFQQALEGDNIAEYLKNDAWEADCNHDTRVFLIRDKNTHQIVFYFSINCGILFKEISDLELSEDEEIVFWKYVSALKATKDSSLSVSERIVAETEWAEAMDEMSKLIPDPDRISILLSLADDKVLIKEEKQEAIKETGEEKCALPVKETFPAIDIKFLCRNANYKLGIKLDFKLGVYVFWEIIVPHLLKISDMVGCKFIYLFAADNTEDEQKELKPAPLYTQEYDPYADEDDEEDEKNVKRLVNYYIREFAFKPVADYKIPKPHYERNCYTLVQEVSELEKNRERIWNIHNADMERESYASTN